MGANTVHTKNMQTDTKVFLISVKKKPKHPADSNFGHWDTCNYIFMYLISTPTGARPFWLQTLHRFQALLSVYNLMSKKLKELFLATYAVTCSLGICGWVWGQNKLSPWETEHLGPLNTRPRTTLTVSLDYSDHVTGQLGPCDFTTWIVLGLIWLRTLLMILM